MWFGNRKLKNKFGNLGKKLGNSLKFGKKFKICQKIWIFGNIFVVWKIIGNLEKKNWKLGKKSKMWEIYKKLGKKFGN